MNDDEAVTGDSDTETEGKVIHITLGRWATGALLIGFVINEWLAALGVGVFLDHLFKR